MRGLAYRLRYPPTGLVKLRGHSNGRRYIYPHYRAVFHNLVVVCARLRSFVRGHYGTGLFNRNNRVFSYHGILDLRATLAREVLASRIAGQ